jgi:hypothetical protein
MNKLYHARLPQPGNHAGGLIRIGRIHATDSVPPAADQRRVRNYDHIITHQFTRWQAFCQERDSAFFTLLPPR